MVCLEEIREQQVIDQKVYDQKLMEDAIRKLEWGGTSKKYCDGWRHDD